LTEHYDGLIRFIVHDLDGAWLAVAESREALV